MFLLISVASLANISRLQPPTAINTSSHCGRAEVAQVPDNLLPVVGAPRW